MEQSFSKRMRLHIAASCTAVFVLMSWGCARQESPSVPESEKQGRPATKLEAFFGKKGQIVVRDIYRLGQVQNRGKAEIDAIVLYEPGKEGDRIRGLKIDVTESGTLERSNTSFLDMDEMESFISGLDYMIGLSKRWEGTRREPYTEVIFSTKGDFSAGFYHSGETQGAFASSGRIGRAAAYLKMEDLRRLKDLTVEGQRILSSK